MTPDYNIHYNSQTFLRQYFIDLGFYAYIYIYIYIYLYI